MSRVIGVIPARFASTRFPGKPLAPLGDRSMIEEVWRRVRDCPAIERVLIATDDQRILDAAHGFGAEAMLTDGSHPSGTDRVAEVIRRLQPSEPEIVINIQGDEPLLTASSLELLVQALQPHIGKPDVMATLAEPISSLEELLDPNVVKLVSDGTGRALYFSRSPVPYYLEATDAGPVPLEQTLRSRPERLSLYRKHQGIYAYTAPALQALTRLEPSPLERAERLEQLRALQAGFRIQIVDSDFRSLGVDTPADLEKVAQVLGLAEAQS